MASNGELSPRVVTLSAAYESGTNKPFKAEAALTVPRSDSVADKTTYLKSLRKAVQNVQEQVNKELTERMEEDKARATAQVGKSKVVVDEAKEEENYGEDAQDEDV